VDLSNRSKPPLTLWRRACEWCLPWSVFSYPGHGRGILAIIGRAVTPQTIHNWNRNDRPPAWAARAMLEHISRRIEAGQQIADALTFYIDVRECEVRYPGMLPRPADR
jgi:hypothetical protein